MSEKLSSKDAVAEAAVAAEEVAEEAAAAQDANLLHGPQRRNLDGPQWTKLKEKPESLSSSWLLELTNASSWTCTETSTAFCPVTNRNPSALNSALPSNLKEPTTTLLSSKPEMPTMPQPVLLEKTTESTLPPREMNWKPSSNQWPSLPLQLPCDQ